MFVFGNKFKFVLVSSNVVFFKTVRINYVS